MGGRKLFDKLTETIKTVFEFLITESIAGMQLCLTLRNVRASFDRWKENAGHLTPITCVQGNKAPEITTLTRAYDH